MKSRTMRDVFIEKICDHMSKDNSILFLSADFGAPAIDRLRKDFKNRFINVGIAEQNLVNVATGLALEGFTVYAYAIAPFLTMRCYEQIRNNLSLMSQTRTLNVNLIGVGAGLGYDVSGPSHFCLEDLSVMRTLPNIDIVSPSDCVLVEKFVEYTLKNKTPKYLRFDGKPLMSIYDQINDLILENGFYELIKGEKICIVSTGYMIHTALKTAKKLLDCDINVGVVDVFLLRPFNEKMFVRLISKYDNIITLEEEFINKGGLDSLVASVLSSRNSNIRIKRIGFKDRHVFNVGNREHLHRLNGLDEASIIKFIKNHGQ